MPRIKEDSEWRSYLTMILLTLVAWQLFAVILRSIALPTPLKVLSAFISMIKEGVLLPHLLVSALRVFYAVALALSMAIPIGLMSREESVDKFVAPFIYLFYPIPHIVLLPLIIILFGIGDLSKIILIAMIVFFQILVTTRDAARNLSREYIYPMLSLGAGWKDIYKHVILPASLPKILTATRVGVGTSIAVLFFVESFATTKGLGYMIMDSWSRVNYPDLYASIITMALLGFGLYIAIDKVEKRICRWVYI